MPLPALGLAAIGAGSSLLGGLFGNKGEQSQTQTTTQSQGLGELPPELLQLLMQQFGQSGALSSQLAGELQNLPGGLGYGALSQNVFGGGLEGILNTSGLTPAVKAAFDEATQGSFDLARKNLEAGLGSLQEQAQQATNQATAAIRGQAGALGLRRSTNVGGAIGNAIAGINRDFGRAVQGGQAQLGQLGVANLQNRSQGLLQAQGLSQQARLGAGQLALGQRGQQIGLRGLTDTNLQNLLQNPLIAQLFQRELATGTQTSTSTGTGSASGGGGLGQAFGGIGGILLEQGLKAA